MVHSIVEYYAEHESYRCGYCKSPDTNYSHGMWAHALTVGDYQDLIDRGWRRSGKYCYKPTMDVTCCPMYTIRCKALEFKPSKSQKKVLKRFNKYLTDQDISDTADGTSRKMSTCSSGADENEEISGEGGEQFVENVREHQDINVTDIVKSNFHDEEELSTGENSEGVTHVSENQLESTKVEAISDIVNQKGIKKGAGPDPTKTPCKKAKLLRRERKLEKLKQKGIDIESSILNSNSNRNKEKQLEDFIDKLPENDKNKLEIKLVRTTPPSSEWMATAKETHEVYVKYQTIIHNDTPEKCTEPKFRDFLVQSPLLEQHSESGPACGYGSFHQQYWLNGKLVAVGVIDILPKCVSSVYFFYDPHYMNLTMGTYGALREIAFTKQLNSFCPEIKYYYMGYYIYSCRKMRYKGNFFPSDLLCPESYKWFPLKDCIPKLEKTPYSRLDPDIDSVDSNFPTSSDLNYIPVLVKGMVMLYKIYKRKCNKKKDKMEELTEYAQLVGAKTAKSLILVR